MNRGKNQKHRCSFAEEQKNSNTANHPATEEESKPTCVVEKLASSKEQTKDFLTLCENSEEVQQNVLMNIIEVNKNSQWGKKYNFASIANLEDYQKEVSLTSWDDYENYSIKMQQGEENILFDGSCEYFIITSGTSGKNKLLPESRLGKCAKDITSKIKDSILMHKFPDLLKGKFLSLSNRAIEGYTESGVPYGSASGVTTQNISKKLAALSAFPLEIKEMTNQEDIDYATMRFALEEDVRVIVGNNGGRIPFLFKIAEDNFHKICQDIADGTLTINDPLSDKLQKKLSALMKPNSGRANELLSKFEELDKVIPDIYWPNLRVIRCWLSGSVGRYIETLKPLVGFKKDLIFFDAGYGASEGKFNIPLTETISSGPLTIHAGFYEFIPVDSNSNNNSTLLAHQLKDGELYRLLITTYSGLYRYDIKDIIKVEGFTGNTPNIVFISKTSDIGNICGEKLSSKILQHGCLQVSKEFNISVTHLCVVPNSDTKSYHFYIEYESQENINVDDFAIKVEEYLQKTAIVYRTYREQQLLNKLTIHKMGKGWQEAIYKTILKPGLTVSQIKLPFIYKTQPLPEYETQSLSDYES